MEFSDASPTPVLTAFLVGAFLSTCIHQLISYLSRRKNPLRLIFFIWVLLVGSISLRYYFLITGIIAPFVSFGQNLLEMGVICCMLSHLVFNHAAKYLKYILPAIALALMVGMAQPDIMSGTQIIMQAFCYLLMGYLLRRLFLLRRPNYWYLFTMAMLVGASFFLFELGPLSGTILLSYSKIILSVAYLLAIITHSAYLNRMAALTSKKFVETEVVARKLQELDQLKTKFFSSVTHEFRTPLTLIQGPVKELMEKTEDHQSRQMLSLIERNSERLLKLINQLLDLARLDAREMKLSAKPLRLDSLVRSTVSQFASAATSRGIELSWNLPQQPVTVLADEEKLDTVLVNLISNALKFTPSGGKVEVNARFDNKRFDFEVKDNGRGIPAEKLSRIFDRFYQVEATDSTHAEGTGIGLALVKEYVELMNGIIHVESKAGFGTAFRVTIGMNTAPDLPETQRSLPVTEHPPEEKMAVNGELPVLLIVDDNADIRLFIKACLGMSYHYVEATNGLEGLEQARLVIPDLIISDLMMPGMDGIELCAAIKGDGRTDHIPFIMLTAKAGQESKVEGLQKGAEEYLVKPFHKEELSLKVQNLMALRQKLNAHIRKELLSQATPVKASSVAEVFVLKARTFIELHLSEEALSVEALADEMNLGREQCYRKLIALTGLSPSSFIRKLRLEKAAGLLASGWGPVSQVSYAVGYNNLSHFSKAFKEEFGKLPSEYSSV